MSLGTEPACLSNCDETHEENCPNMAWQERYWANHFDLKSWPWNAEHNRRQLATFALRKGGGAMRLRAGRRNAGCARGEEMSTRAHLMELEDTPRVRTHCLTPMCEQAPVPGGLHCEPCYDHIESEEWAEFEAKRDAAIEALVDKDRDEERRR